ncbi:MAG: carboxypeptidase regulatory-like domain-containing protein [Pirellulales bacterium]|nr:carboxypeptidase regulatory-like domain-containing protein [Pirellulales bacterium]
MIDDSAAGPNWDELPPEFRCQLEGLQHRVRRGKRRSILLSNATIAAVLLGLACLATLYATSVLSYAKIDPDFDIRRDVADPDRVALCFRPLSSGTIGFARTDGSRQTEVLDRIVPGAAGGRQEFDWRIGGLQTGDVISVTYLDGWRRTTQPLRVPPIGAAAGQGVLRGQIVNAINNQPVPHARVRVEGTSLGTETDAGGAFRIEGASIGPQRIEVSADGFTGGRFERELTADDENYVRVALSPGMAEGQIRIVLTWGRTPEDLDAHLEGPLPDDTRFHVYHGRPGDLKSEEFVRLDVDNRRGWGPETVTVLGVSPGVYRYYVHDYTNRHNLRSNTLAQSRAEVRLYQSGQTYVFRAGGDQVGNVWDICAIRVTPEGTAEVEKIDRYRTVESENVTEEKYKMRTEADRLAWIGDYGGSPQSERAVAEGLEWLARHQAPEGFWSSECLADGKHSQCEPGAPCAGPGRKYEMAQTGLALLAFQAGGHYYFNGRQYSDRVRRALDWMVAHQRPDGALVSDKPKEGHSRYHSCYMYDQGIATFALADACAAAIASGEPVGKRYLEACQKAVLYIESQQHDDGGWRYTDKFERPGDTSVSGWQALALKSAQEAGLEVSSRCIEDIRAFFRRMLREQNGRTWYRNDGYEVKQESDATTGIGMLVRQFLFDETDAPVIGEAAAYLADLAERSAAEGVVESRGLAYRLEYNYYTWYNCTLAMFHAGGEPWNRWNGIIRDTVVGLQRHDGCERGSWDPDTRWGDRGGRIYTTALAVLTLEVYYRYSRRGDVPRGPDALRVLSEDEQVQGVPVEPEPASAPERRTD